MRKRLSQKDNEVLFGDNNPNEVLLELSRWLVSPGYKEFVSALGLPENQLWLDVFKMAVLSPRISNDKATVEESTEDFGFDASIEF